MALENQDNVTTYVDEADSTTTYVGIAPRGSATSKDNWQIKLILVSDTITSITYPNGDDRMAFVWDDRTTYTYS